MTWFNKKNIVVVLVVITTAIAGLSIYSHSQKVESKISETFKKIESAQQFSDIMAHNGEKLLIFDLYADWCGPCHVLSPRLVTLSQKYADKANFYRINIDALPDVAASFGTNAIPYVVFVKGQKVIGSLTGLNPSESYEKVINACALADADSCAAILQTL